MFALFALSASTTSFCWVLSGGTWRTEPKPQLYIYPSNLYMDGHLQHAGNKKPLKLNSTYVWNSWRRSWTMPNLGGKLARKDGPWIAQMMRFNVSIETWTSDRNGNIIYYIQIQTAQKELLNLDSTRLDYNVWALCYTSEISREPWDAAQKTGLMWLGVYGSLLSLNFLSKSLNVSHSFIRHKIAVSTIWIRFSVSPVKFALHLRFLVHVGTAWCVLVRSWFRSSKLHGRRWQLWPWGKDLQKLQRCLKIKDVLGFIFAIHFGKRYSYWDTSQVSL